MTFDLDSGHMGVTRVKSSFSQKSFNSSTIRRMVMLLIHMTDLDIPNKSYKLKTKISEVIWGPWGQKVIFTENVITRACYKALP